MNDTRNHFIPLNLVAIRAIRATLSGCAKGAAALTISILVLNQTCQHAKG